MRLKPLLIKRTIICSISILTISVIALLLIYKPLSDTATAPATPVTDEGASSANAIDEKEITAVTADIATDDKSPASSTKRQINIYVTSSDYDFYKAVEAYANTHWSFAYNLNLFIDSTNLSTGDVMSMVNSSLISGDGAVDIYRLPARYAPYYIKGDYSGYACTYRELGIDVDAALKNAEIPEYIIEAGRNPDGEVIALPYISDPSVFLYRRSVAKDVWGTDDPGMVANIIGGGTRQWDKFIEAAKTLKKHGYYIAPGFTDLSCMINQSHFSSAQVSAKGYVVDPVWEEFMDVSKQLFDSGCINDTRCWSDQWYDDLDGKGDKVFGLVTYTNFIESIIDETAGDWAICLPPFSAQMDVNTGVMVSKDSQNKDLLGPLVEWMTLDCSKEGLQYGLANGALFNGKKMTVVSGTALKNTDGSRDVLGGQNVNTVIYDALKQPMKNYYGDYSLTLWNDAIEAYLKGNKSKETVIEELNSKLKENGAFYGSGMEPESTAASDLLKDEIIVWKDKNFEAAVREELFKPNSDIYKSDTSRITKLYLTGRKIDNLEDIAHFKKLTRLYLESNKITDISCLKDLTKLKVLNISDNNISDISVLSGLTELRELDMSQNMIGDISSLEGLSGLEQLTARYNVINDISSLRSMGKLKYLDLSFNKISDISSLSGLTSLESAYLGDNKINDISALKKSTSLKKLDLKYNKISNISSLKGLVKLEELDLSSNKISDISSLKGMVNLGILYLQSNEIHDISSIKYIKDLSYLNLAGNDVTDRSPADHAKYVEWGAE